MAPGLGTCTVAISPVFEHHVGEEALVAARQHGGNERGTKSHGGRHIDAKRRAWEGLWAVSRGDLAAKLVLDVHANDFVERRSAAKPSASARRGSNRRGQPATMRATSGSGMRRMRAATLSPAIRRNAAICSATVQQTPGMVRLTRGPSLSRRQSGGMNEKADRGARTCMPVHDAVLDRQHGFLAGKRLANDRGEEARCRLVRPAGPYEMVGSLMPMPSTKPRRL